MTASVPVVLVLLARTMYFGVGSVRALQEENNLK